METRPVIRQKPRVFFIIPSLNGGGAERVLINLGNHFNKLNCQPVIISLNYCQPAYPIDKGVEVITLLNRKQNSLGHRIYYIVQTFYKLMYLLLKQKPVCVLAFITSANLWAGVTCSLTGTRYIVSERTSPKRTVHKLNFFAKNLTAFLYKKAYAVVVSAKGVEYCLRQNAVLKKLNNIHRIANAIPVFNAASTARVHHRKFILGVGRLSYVKGFDQLIEAFSRAGLPETDLLLIGDGPERAALTRLAGNLGLTGRVIFAGTKLNLQDYYSQAELFVLPSRNEGYPNALVEAMSFGCPCIAMNCEFGPAEIISNGHNGLLVEAANIDALAGAMARLINNPSLKASLSRQALAINQTNSAQQIFTQWEGLILEARQ